MAQSLILDDEQPLLQSLTLELGRGGHHCLPAETGSEAMRIIEKESIDMAILDDDGEPLPQGQIGEVSIRSVCNFLGYWKNEDATKAAFSKDG